MSAILIEDGYTLSKALAARPGLHPAVDVRFRPALSRKRHEYAKALAAGDPAKADAWESDLLAAHVVGLNGDPLPREKCGRVAPELRKALIDLVLGYEPADEPHDEAADLKN